MQNEISGFWRRLGAFCIDVFVLGAIGLVLGIFFSRQFVELGGWGRAVGAPIAILYFAVFNSRLGNGQTIGKRVMGIRVVEKDGALLSFPKGLLRALVLALPYFLNGAQVSESLLTSIAGYLLSLSVFGMGLSAVYLVIFNRNTRQSFHDLLLGTCVVRLHSERDVALKPVWPVHYAVTAVLLTAALVLPAFTGMLAKRKVFSQLLETRRQIEGPPQVVFATVQDGTSTFRSTGGVKRTTTYISTQVFIRTDTIDDNAFAEEIATIILRTHKEARQRNLIQVVLTYGYDIGIASFWKRHRHQFSPEQLTDKTNREV